MAHFTTSVHRGKGQMPNCSVRSEAVQAHHNKNCAGLIYLELEGRIIMDYSETVINKGFIGLGDHTLVCGDKLTVTVIQRCSRILIIGAVQWNSQIQYN